MKKYAIYQFFIDTLYNERNLLVGFVKAKNEKEAKEKYTNNDLTRGYLSAHECSDEDFNKPELLEAIERNKAELGVWA